jgi:NRAMP (natural resistance-associated macrophage protein)-like metal ion transporter
MKILNILKYLRSLGPGFISGAADNDPAGIATYTQVGAQFGYGQLWTVIFALPLLTATQDACARIGAVTGKGLAAIIKDNYSAKVLYAAVFLILIANTINIGADLGAIVAAAKLIIPLPFIVIMFAFISLILILEIFTSYKTYAKYLKWLAFLSLSYLVTVFIVHEPWGNIVKATFIPHFEFSFAFIFIIVGNIGTTIAPYLFFWETSQEVEEDKEHHLIKKNKRVLHPAARISKIRFDNAVGMFSSQIVTWSIIVLSATVLHAHGITDLKTAADAAKALEPLVHTFPNAGFFAKSIFAVGIISAGLLVIPVLSGSVSYALSETLNWKEGLNIKLTRAPKFYAVIIIVMLIGLITNFLGVDPIKLLIYTSVLNGIAAVPLLFLISKIARNEKIMHEHKSGLIVSTLIWITFLVMAFAAIALFATFMKK